MTVIAVCTIAKNEEKFAERWARSAEGADFRLVLDTGSNDNTVTALLDCGVAVRRAVVSPWRFDDARNISFAMLPPQVTHVITLDMDEVLEPNWREGAEAGTEFDQCFYHYHWSDDIYFHGNRYVRRGRFRWKHPVHETLFPVDKDISSGFANFTIRHLPDPTKSRGQYLPLLRAAVLEDPNDDRLSHYYARELFFTGNWDLARAEFVRHISISRWPPERAQSYRYLAQMDDHPERWILHAIAEDTERREPWVDLIKLYKKQGRSVQDFIFRALTISTRPVDYMTENSAWDDDYVRRLGNE